MYSPGRMNATLISDMSFLSAELELPDEDEEALDEAEEAPDEDDEALDEEALDEEALDEDILPVSASFFSPQPASTMLPVSYTHLDVYKRQVLRCGVVQIDIGFTGCDHFRVRTVIRCAHMSHDDCDVRKCLRQLFKIEGMVHLLRASVSEHRNFVLTAYFHQRIYKIMIAKELSLIHICIYR